MPVIPIPFFGGLLQVCVCVLTQCVCVGGGGRGLEGGGWKLQKNIHAAVIRTQRSAVNMYM
jgi:hypothetical protein